jgi:hypothetical protein
MVPRRQIGVCQMRWWGRGSRIAAAACAASLMAAACSSSAGFLEGSAAPTPTPEPTPAYSLDATATPEVTPEPTLDPNWTPSPTPAPTFDSSAYGLGQICAGVGDPLAAAYKGASHPTAVLDYSDKDYPSIMGYSGPDGDIQLVACVGAASSARVKNCGQYKRSSDGKIGYIYSYKQVRTVSIRIAQTGKQLAAKALSGNAASCNQSFTIPATGNPPWSIAGGPVPESTIMAYVKAYSK